MKGAFCYTSIEVKKMKKNKKRNSKGKLKQILLTLGFMLLGMICGILMMLYGGVFDRATGEISLAAFAVLFVSMYVAMYFQIAVHEAGHLVFGLATGYEFCSYRLGKIILIKQGERLALKRYSLAGTGGQCLMSPPEIKDGKMPVVLYNLGGSIMNLFAAAVSVILFLLLRDTPIVSTIFLMSAVIGVFFAALNGIPMRLGAVDNDGYNAISIRKSEKSMRSFYIQLKLITELSKGKRLKDLPSEWFGIPTDEEMKNSMVASIGVLCCNRLMDSQSFTEAQELMEHFLSIGSGIVGVQKNLLLCDILYCELIGEKRKEKIDELLTKDMKKILKARVNNPSALRTQYAYALINQNDEKKTEKIKKRFDKVFASYPYSGEAQSERELFEIVNSYLR